MSLASFGNLKQLDSHEFKASLGYNVRTSLKIQQQRVLPKTIIHYKLAKRISNNRRKFRIKHTHAINNSSFFLALSPSITNSARLPTEHEPFWRNTILRTIGITPLHYWGSEIPKGL